MHICFSPIITHDQITRSGPRCSVSREIAATWLALGLDHEKRTFIANQIFQRLPSFHGS